MTEFALRPDGAGPRSGSELLFSNRIRAPFVGIGVAGSAVAEVPPGPTADRERPRWMAPALRIDAAADSGRERRFPNCLGNHLAGTGGVHESDIAGVPPGRTADRNRPRMTATRRPSGSTGPDAAGRHGGAAGGHGGAAGGHGGAAARLARRPVAPGERRDAPEPAR